jgi:hypothetical protein
LLDASKVQLLPALPESQILQTTELKYRSQIKYIYIERTKQEGVAISTSCHGLPNQVFWDGDSSILDGIDGLVIAE